MKQCRIFAGYSNAFIVIWIFVNRRMELQARLRWAIEQALTLAHIVLLKAHCSICRPKIPRYKSPWWLAMFKGPFDIKDLLAFEVQRRNLGLVRWRENFVFFFFWIACSLVVKFIISKRKKKSLAISSWSRIRETLFQLANDVKVTSCN